MSIVVFWIDAGDTAAMQSFEDGQLLDALAHAELKRRQGLRHITISTELAGSVGSAGVDEIKARKLPDGSDYDWSKAHRGKSPPRKQR
ncbi:hypothetical protein [Roseateles violae]|uniref:Uncharacterized protein n=1 Tax=Roseateles violae TaxID=3058042 RepID=A0ABT8DVN1_9BURK|nr:hypothetical protein [Pelomonas sp. PFR6]MDN3920354.1 hypothetical protein [Pelomonas sp. PFR6]